MPRYFFHVRDGGELIEDPDGVECPDADAARVEAIGAARDIMADRARKGLDVSHWAFKITDPSGMLVMNMPFSEAIRRT